MEKNNNIKFLDKKWVLWFVGFLDAEGNFQVYPKKRVLKSGEVSKYNVGLGFHLSLHSRDIDILIDIKKKLNDIGVIYKYKDRLEARLAVNDRSSLLYLINIFDLYPFLTNHQLLRYRLLREVLINEVKEFKKIQEYNDYKTKCLLLLESEIKQKNSIENIILLTKNGREEQLMNSLIEYLVPPLPEGFREFICFYKYFKFTSLKIY